MAVALEQFVRHLTTSGLMSAAEVTSFQQKIPPDKRPKDGEALARELVRANKLTKYQAQAIYQGKVKGLVFGDYRVLDKLGQGGMGVVLKAEHRRMKRVVAVKMIAGAALKSPDAVKRFYREVEAAAKLNHPNIVQAHDASEHDGIHYLVMEYVDGKDLAAIVKERGSLPIAQAVDYVIQAARGLQYAHMQKIVHRDIKPANVLLDKEGTVKILDMGLARIAGLVEEEDKDRLTASGQVMGTCDYMAPEQAMDTHHADARADIYSLGCTLYRLLTGDTMYKGETLAKILVSHQMAPIPSLSKMRGDVPQPLDAVFQKMVAKKPENRYQSMAEVIAALEVCVGKRAAPARSDGEDATAAFSGEDNLAFLKTAAPGNVVTAGKQKVERLAEATFSQQAAAETSRQLSSNERLLASARKKKTRFVTIGLGLLGVIGAIVLAVTIRVRHGDEETVVTVPNGSKITVSKKDDVNVTVKAEGKREFVAPVFKGGFDPKLAAQSQSSSPMPPAPSPSPFVGPDGNWKLPPGAPPPAIAPFDATKAKQHQEAWARHLNLPAEETNSIGMKLALIPPGEFEMGSTPEEIAVETERAKKNTIWQSKVNQVVGEQPRHHVKITKPFYLATYPVTQNEFEKVMSVNPSAFTEKQMEVSAFQPPLAENYVAERERDVTKVAGRDTSRHPVETVSCEEAMEFCRRLSAMPTERAARRVSRLPTEAEWEYACRAGTTTRWYCGDDEAGFVERDRLNKNSGFMTEPVGEKKPNAWGLYDMHGNVWQWCADWYSADYYKHSPGNDPPGPPGGSARVVRGGDSFLYFFCPSCCRSASRYHLPHDNHHHSNGFRVTVEIPVKSEIAEPKAERSATTSPYLDPKGDWKLPPDTPIPAVAPFDATKAKQHQEAWAKHLNLPVEETNSIGMKLALIPPGEFEMGSTPEEIAAEIEHAKMNHESQEYLGQVPSEGPRHRVRITKPFHLGMYQVTQAEYEKVMGVNPSAFTATQMTASAFKPRLAPKQIEEREQDVKKVMGKDASRHPVETVNWDETMEFCSKLSAMPAEQAVRRVYRLPTEAEWEFACRAGTTTRWWCGQDEAGVLECAWFSDNARKMTHPVGQKRPNAWGLYDLRGNAWQWCADWFSNDYYQQSPPNDPAGPSAGSSRVLRGGGWNHSSSFCRSACRGCRGPADRDHRGGFRVVAEIVAKEQVGK